MSVVTIDDTDATRGKATSLASLAAALLTLIGKELKHAFSEGEPMGIIQSQMAARSGHAIVYECDSWLGWTQKKLD